MGLFSRLCFVWGPIAPVRTTSASTRAARVCLAVLGATTYGCDGAPGDARALTQPTLRSRWAAESAAVVGVAREIVDADNARSLARVMATYSDSIQWLPPGEPPVVGREHIRARYVTLFEQFDPAIESRITEVLVRRSMATVVGNNGGVLRSRGRGADRVLNDWFLMVLVKADRGEWKIRLLTWHPMPSPGSP